MQKEVRMQNKVSYDSFADVYDLLMQDIDYDAWTAYLQTFLQKAPRTVRKVTDAGCGTGSLSIRLADKGYSVTAMDLSEEMLAVAAERAREAGLQIAFARQDISQLILGRCDALICGCDVINYLSSVRVQEFIRRAYEGLARGGVLLFDISSAYKLQQILGNQIYYEDREELSYFWRNTLHSDRVEMELTFFLKRGELYERRDERQTQYIHAWEQLLDQLRAAGFEAEAYAFGSEAAPEAHSDRILFAAYKPKERNRA